MRVEFHVNPNDSVHTLKQMIKEMDGKPIGMCLLHMRILRLTIWMAFRGAKA
jgi:hypothetical protein